MQQSLELEALRNKVESGAGNVDNEELHTMKKKSIEISKNWKGLRFFLKQEGTIAHTFKKEGLTMLAKKVKQDMKLVVAGKKSVSEIIEENLSSLIKHVPHNNHLISNITEFLKKHDDDDTHLNYDNDEDMNNIDNDDNDNDNNNKMPDDIDIEEKLEDIENLRMFIENYRTKCVHHIRVIETELQHKENDKKQLINTNNDLMKKIDDHQHTINISIDTEKRLLSQLTDLDRNFNDQLDYKSKEISKIQKINNDLENSVNAHTNTISNIKTLLETKDNEIEKLISNIQVISNNLESTNLSKKLIEDESARIRAEMTERMHKLRSNMHSILHRYHYNHHHHHYHYHYFYYYREESESKIVESQITQLTSELEATKHELELASSSSSLSRQEIGKLKLQLEFKLTDERHHIMKQEVILITLTLIPMLILKLIRMLKLILILILI